MFLPTPRNPDFCTCTCTEYTLLFARQRGVFQQFGPILKFLGRESVRFIPLKYQTNVTTPSSHDHATAKQRQSLAGVPPSGNGACTSHAAQAGCRVHPVPRLGDHVFVAGQIPFRDGKLLAAGTVPATCPCRWPSNAPGSAERAGGRTRSDRRGGNGRRLVAHRAVRATGRVCRVRAGVHRSPEVANGASELLVEVFGDRGRHAQRRGRSQPAARSAGGS